MYESMKHGEFKTLMYILVWLECRQYVSNFCVRLTYLKTLLKCGF